LERAVSCATSDGAGGSCGAGAAAEAPGAASDAPGTCEPWGPEAPRPLAGAAWRAAEGLRGAGVAAEAPGAASDGLGACEPCCAEVLATDAGAGAAPAPALAPRVASGDPSGGDRRDVETLAVPHRPTERKGSKRCEERRPATTGFAFDIPTAVLERLGDRLAAAAPQEATAEDGPGTLGMGRCTSVGRGAEEATKAPEARVSSSEPEPPRDPPSTGARAYTELPTADVGGAAEGDAPVISVEGVEGGRRFALRFGS